MPVTAFYASLLAALFFYLSVRVIQQRREARVEIGPGENRELLRRMRVHANFTEYAPFILLLLALAESLGVTGFLLHPVGLALIAGRCIHAYGLSQSPHNIKQRVLGMTLTFGALGAAALLCFTYAIAQAVL